MSNTFVHFRGNVDNISLINVMPIAPLEPRVQGVKTEGAAPGFEPSPNKSIFLWVCNSPGLLPSPLQFGVYCCPNFRISRVSLRVSFDPVSPSFAFCVQAAPPTPFLSTVSGQVFFPAQQTGSCFKNPYFVWGGFRPPHLLTVVLFHAIIIPLGMVYHSLMMEGYDFPALTDCKKFMSPASADG